MTSWDPTQYLRYADERARPFSDLVARIRNDAPVRVVDLGCGPGNTTATLGVRWPMAQVIGVDSSPTMIEQAQVHASPNLRFVASDVAAWDAEPESFDVIVSNATLQWVPGHIDLFDRWLKVLCPGGTLAFQVPGNWAAPSHTEIARLATSPAWRESLGRLPDPKAVYSPVQYLDRLRTLGASVDMWETTYFHQLSGSDPVLEWFRGSALLPYLAVLGDDDAGRFISEYAEAMQLAYPRRPDGSTLLPFRRVFVVATPGAQGGQE